MNRDDHIILAPAGTRDAVPAAVRCGADAVISLKNVSREALNISEDELMERFVRGDSARTSEGSGLGLSIAKSLVQLQKGEMELNVDGDLFKISLIFDAV